MQIAPTGITGLSRIPFLTWSWFSHRCLTIMSVAVNQLGGEQVASLADCGLVISDALDELLTRSRG